MESYNDQAGLAEATAAARKAAEIGDDPYGAAITNGGTLLAAARNTVHSQHDPSNHAEVNAIRKAAAELGTEDLSNCTLYATCEPCPMCWSLILWSRIGRVVIGAKDPLYGGTDYQPKAFPRPELIFIESPECEALLKEAVSKQRPSSVGVAGIGLATFPTTQ